MITKNPWLGLASYEEKTDQLFCGRDKETIEMVRLIDNNLFVTLYGSSGIGKTSLLRAGVIPILRRKDYVPIYVRLSQETEDLPYAATVVTEIKKRNLEEIKGAEVKHSDAGDRLYLWEYFATTRFLSEGREVYPVIILDQFEEVFREGDKAKAELLLKQIYLLLNDELEMPDEAGWSADTNYRFVASIREDFLFVLEDSIDENSLDLYKNNRYRLRPMKPEQARQVVLVPGKDCIEETEKEAVAESIIGLAKRPQSNDIDTLLLSLVCSGTYEKKSGEKIAPADLAVWRNNPMEVYYQDAVKGLKADQILFIQKEFIREDGSRKSVDVKKAKLKLGEATYLELTKGSNRLFAGDKGQVELLHDQLGMAVLEERKAFEELEQSKRKRLLLVLVMLPMLFLIVAVIVAITVSNKLNRREQVLLEHQSRYVAEKVFDLVDEGDSCLAQLLSLEVLPQDLSHPNRPYTMEAERALRKATMHFPVIDSALSAISCPDSLRIGLELCDSTIRIRETVTGKCIRSLEGHKSVVTSASYSSDRKHIVSASLDKTIRVWDAATGQCLLILEGQESPVNLVKFSHDGEHIVSGCQDGTIRIWDFPPLQELIKKTISQCSQLKDSLLTPKIRQKYYLDEKLGSRNLKDNRSIDKINKDDYYFRIKR